MNKMILTLGTALLLGTGAGAAPAPSVNDRIAELCAVSNTDLEGQRLARACRAEVRARNAAKELARAGQRPIRTAEAGPRFAR